jgi:hypothetical protein
METKKTKDILEIDVNTKVEKKNGLNYLSWAWAWTEALKIDNKATWEVVEYNGLPLAYLRDETAFVKTKVTLNGETKECVLPVMDNRNKAVVNPDSFIVNKTIMRCLAKNLAMFGLGLYIYAGEDLPEVSDEIKEIKAQAKEQEKLEQILVLEEKLQKCKDKEELKVILVEYSGKGAEFDKVIHNYLEMKKAQAKAKEE